MEMPSWSSALEKESLAKRQQKLPSLNRVRPFAIKLLAWYENNGREFSWRRKGIGLYEVVITELLLQRTRAETVAKFISSFLEGYPDWECLAEKSVQELEFDLQPIGLQRRRADSLSLLAKTIVIQYGGELPQLDEELASLPAVGQYIFCAIKLYRDNDPQPLLDASMARLVERFFGPRSMADIRYDPYLQQLCRKILTTGPPRELNWAMLDFATAVCTGNKPACSDCLLLRNCRKTGVGL